MKADCQSSVVSHLDLGCSLVVEPHVFELVMLIKVFIQEIMVVYLLWTMIAF